MANILDLPSEVLIIIFSYLHEHETQKEFYYRLTKVCARFKDISKNGIFWKKIDGSISEINLHQLSKNSCLIKTEDLKYCSAKKLKCTKKLEEIFAGLPNLRFVDFSQVEKMDQDVLTCLHKCCVKLSGIKLSDELYLAKYTVSFEFLGDFLKVQGSVLSVLDLSYLEIKNLNKLVNAIAESCPNLEELLIQDIKCIGCPLFPLKPFQKNCQKLKVLRLGFPIYFSQHANKSLPGFPMLEIFTHPNREIWKFFDKDFINILSKSSSLKILDMRACRYITVDSVLSLPATHVENLYLSSTRLTTTERLGEVLDKWSSSLRVLDISKMTLEYLNDILSDLCSANKLTNLEHLNLNNTKVTPEVVVELLKNCKKLDTLNLISCRSVGRGFMQQFHGKTELDQLYNKLLGKTSPILMQLK